MMSVIAMTISTPITIRTRVLVASSNFDADPAASPYVCPIRGYAMAEKIVPTGSLLNITMIPF